VNYIDKAEDCRVCGECRWLKEPPVWNVDRLRRAVEEGFFALLRETAIFSRQSYWSSRENCWVHILDTA